MAKKAARPNPGDEVTYRDLIKKQLNKLGFCGEDVSDFFNVASKYNPELISDRKVTVSIRNIDLMPVFLDLRKQFGNPVETRKAIIKNTYLLLEAYDL